jgi:carbohydrate diacid regulator
MELTASLGEKIINETKKLINENIIIVNKDAIIIASTDSTRIGHFHEGALRTIERNEMTILSEEHMNIMRGIRPGINLPITMNDEVIGVIGITGDPIEVKPFASLMQKMTELLIRESVYIQETEWHARAQESFFLEWVQMDEIPENFKNRTHLHGFDLSPPFRCTIIRIESNVIPAKKLNDILHILRLKMSGQAILWGDKRLLLVTEESKYASLAYLQQQLESFQNYISITFDLQLSIGIGIGSVNYRLKESYQTALKALSIGEKNAITIYENLLLEICLDEIPLEKRIEFTNKLLAQLGKESNLLETLKVYLANDLHVKKTANELHIHINTLHYRLNRLEELTQLNPRSSYSITLFYLLFYFLDK